MWTFYAVWKYICSHIAYEYVQLIAVALMTVYCDISLLSVCIYCVFVLFWIQATCYRLLGLVAWVGGVSQSINVNILQSVTQPFINFICVPLDSTVALFFVNFFLIL